MPIMDESDVSLPKATLSKMIRELTPNDLRLGSDSLDMLIECCTEFVNLLSTESNDVSTREKKNTIHPEHVLKALEELGFGEFVPDVKEAWNSWKEENKNKSAALRPRGHKTAADAAGYSEEQQIAMQQKLFADAKARSNSFQDPHASSTVLEEKTFMEGVTPESLTRMGQISVSDTSMHPTSITRPMPSSIYAELAARSDVLPIHPLPVSPIASDFKPNVINSVAQPIEQNDTEMASETDPAAKQQPVLDFRHIAMSQPVIILHDGRQHLVSWQTVLSQVARLPQLSQQPLENLPAGECSIQMPVTSYDQAMQPSFPDSIPAATLTPTVGNFDAASLPVDDGRHIAVESSHMENLHATECETNTAKGHS